MVTRSTLRQTGIPPLRAVREAQGLGLRQAARLSGIDPGYLSKVERGEGGLRLDSLHRLARVLGLKDLARLLAPYVIEPPVGEARRGASARDREPADVPGSR